MGHSERFLNKCLLGDKKSTHCSLYFFFVGIVCAWTADGGHGNYRGKSRFFFFF